MKQTEAEGQPMDIILLNRRLEANWEPDLGSSTAIFLGSMIHHGYQTSRIGEYVSVVLELAARRRCLSFLDRVGRGELSLDDVVEEAVSLQARLVRRGSSREERVFRRLDLSPNAYEEQGKHDWVVEPVAAVPDAGLLVGDGGVGKTKLAASLSLAVAFSLPVFGRFRTAGGKALFIEEEPGDTLRRYLFDLAPGLGIPPNQIADRIVAFAQSGFRLDDEGWLRLLARELEVHRPRLVIYDCLVRMHRGDENEQRFMTGCVEAVQRLANDFGHAAILVHHTGKSEEARSLGAMSRGASAIFDAVDSYFHVGQKKGDRERLVVTMGKTRRLLLPPFELHLRHDEEGRIREVLYEGRVPTKAEQAVTAILEIVRDAPRTTREVQQAVGDRFGKRAVEEALQKIREANLAPWSRDGNRGGFRYGPAR